MDEIVKGSVYYHVAGTFVEVTAVGRESVLLIKKLSDGYKGKEYSYRTEELLDENCWRLIQMGREAAA